MGKKFKYGFRQRHLYFAIELDLITIKSDGFGAKDNFSQVVKSEFLHFYFLLNQSS